MGQHKDWRSFYNERKTEPMEGFIDGDLVETFLDLDRPIMEDIVSGMQMPDEGSGMKTDAKVEDIIKTVGPHENSLRNRDKHYILNDTLFSPRIIVAVYLDFNYHIKNLRPHWIIKSTVVR